jgi:hypothetical protein
MIIPCQADEVLAVQMNSKEIFLGLQSQKVECFGNLLRADISGERLQMLVDLFPDGQYFIDRSDLFDLERSRFCCSFTLLFPKSA